MLFHAEVGVFALLDGDGFTAEWADRDPLVLLCGLVSFWADMTFQSPVVLAKALMGGCGKEEEVSKQGVVNDHKVGEDEDRGKESVVFTKRSVCSIGKRMAKSRVVNRSSPSSACQLMGAPLWRFRASGWFRLFFSRG